MSIRDGHHYRKVSFDTKEELGVKIDKLAVMIGKLATRDSRTNRQFKPHIHQSRGRGQNRNYNQRNHQNRNRQNNRPNRRDRGQYRQDRRRPRHEKILGEIILEEMLDIMVDKIVEESIEIAKEMPVMIEAETGLEKGHFSEIMAIIELEVKATVDPGQDPELAQIGIEFIVISVGNMIILQETVPLLGKKGNLTAPTNAKFGR